MHTWIAAEDDKEYFNKKKQSLPQTGKRAPTSLVEEQKRGGEPQVLVLVLVLVLVAP